jgi:hypothetical protein
MKKIPSLQNKNFKELLPLSPLIPGSAQGIHARGRKNRTPPLTVLNGPRYFRKLLIIIDFLDLVNCKSEPAGKNLLSHCSTATWAYMSLAHTRYRAQPPPVEDLIKEARHTDEQKRGGLVTRVTQPSGQGVDREISYT